MSACPKCRSVELRMPRSGTPALRCYRCHGMWISLQEAEELLMRGSIRDPESMLPQKQDGDAITGLCPDGHGILARARIEPPNAEPFYLERCGTCLGVWFDGGEWARLASLHLETNLADLWDPERRREMRERRLEEAHRARMVELFGAGLVERVEALAREFEAHPRRRELEAFLRHRLGI